MNLFITKVPAPLPPIQGDRDLVENALKFTSVRDLIEVRTLVEVADSGAERIA